jgi:hypothetical protein
MGRVGNTAGSGERLVRLKNKYDPTNLFRLNQNIKPTGKRIDAATRRRSVTQSASPGPRIRRAGSI